MKVTRMITKPMATRTLELPPQYRQVRNTDFLDSLHSLECITEKLNQRPHSELYFDFLILAGPSCVGKSALLDYMKNSNCSNIDWKILRRFTTREKRINEKCTELSFVSPNRFEELRQADKFLYTTGNEITNSQYGLLKETLVEGVQKKTRKTSLVLIETIALTRLLPNSHIVYLVPPSLDELKSRIYASKKPYPERILDCDINELDAMLRFAKTSEIGKYPISFILNDDLAICKKKITNLALYNEQQMDVPSQLITDIIGAIYPVALATDKAPNYEYEFVPGYSKEIISPKQDSSRRESGQTIFQSLVIAESPIRPGLFHEP